MEELIKFRLHADSLSDKELQSLVQETIGSTKQLMTVSHLFHHFRDNLYESAESIKLQQLNQSISQWNHDNNNDQLILSPEVDKISQSLINNIASYLDVISYYAFAQCNRTIFIATHSPCQLHTVPPALIEWYVECRMQNQRPFDTHKFARLHALHYTSFRVNFVFSHLRHVSINAIHLYDFVGSVGCNNLHVEHLHTLQIYGYNSSHDDAFNRLLQCVPHLARLHLYCYDPPTIDLDMYNQPIFKQLKELSLVCHDPKQRIYVHDWYSSCAQVNDILDLCSSNLIAFKTDLDLIQLNLNHVLFPHLRELLLRSIPNTSVIDKIVQFDLQTFGGMVDHFELTAQFMNKLFEMKSLDTVCVVVEMTKFRQFNKLIQNALMIHHKRELKVYLQCRMPKWKPGVFNSYLTNGLLVDFEAFVNTLKNMVSDDFLFVLNDFCKCEMDVINKWLFGMHDPKVQIEVMENAGYHGDVYSIVVTNKGCKMNGYSKQMHMMMDFEWIQIDDRV
eukprot:20703_1